MDQKVTVTADDLNSNDELYAVTMAHAGGDQEFNIPIASVNCTSVDDDVLGFRIVQTLGDTEVSEAARGRYVYIVNCWERLPQALMWRCK